MITTVEVPKYDKVVSLTNSEELAMKNDILTVNSGGANNMKIWNNTLKKLRIWNGSDFENVPNFDNFLVLKVEYGDIVFNNEKIKNIVFDTPFTGKPAIDITLDENETSIPFKTNITNNGFTINFASKYTGGLTWKAIKK